jgi:hypothetical protein
MENPGTSYVVELLGQALAAANQQIAELQAEVATLRTQSPPVAPAVEPTPQT